MWKHTSGRKCDAQADKDGDDINEEEEEEEEYKKEKKIGVRDGVKMR